MKKFKKVYIEITNVCNLSCNFCPKTNRKPKFMNLDEFKYVVSQVKPYTDYIYFHVMGEPLLNNNIGAFLDYLDKESIKANITTNGVLISKYKDLLIEKKALRQVNISLHSFEANDTDIDFYQYIDDVSDFINSASENSHIICSIRLWNIDNEELKGENGLNSKILNRIEKNLGLGFSISHKLLEKHSLKLKDRVYLNMAEKFQWPDIDIDHIHDEVFCYGLRTHMGVLVDGTVVPCCLDSEGNVDLGNIFDMPLKDILSSERAINLYEGFSSRRAVEDLCKRCRYASRFKK